MDAHDEAAALARSIFQLRRERARHLPPRVLSDVCWTMLLALFVADADGRRITAREATDAAEVPIAVGERWLKLLHAEGLAIGDGDGRIDDVVTLTPAGVSAVEACMRDAQRLIGTRGRAATGD